MMSPMSAQTLQFTPRLSEVVAANIRAEAARRGWSQDELGRRMGIARTSVSERHRDDCATGHLRYYLLDEDEQP